MNVQGKHLTHGIIRVWDSYSFATVRYFPSPNARPSIGGDWEGVKDVLVRGDLLVGSVGRKVFGWVGGPVGRDRDGHRMNGKGKRAARSSKGTGGGGVAKWHRKSHDPLHIERY